MRDYTKKGKTKTVRDYTNSEVAAVIAERIHSERDREMLKDRLINGMTYARLAEKYDLSTRYCQHLMGRLENIVFKHLPTA